MIRRADPPVHKINARLNFNGCERLREDDAVVEAERVRDAEGDEAAWPTAE